MEGNRLRTFAHTDCRTGIARTLDGGRDIAAAALFGWMLLVAHSAQDEDRALNRFHNFFTKHWVAFQLCVAPAIATSGTRVDLQRWQHILKRFRMLSHFERGFCFDFTSHYLAAR